MFLLRLPLEAQVGVVPDVALRPNCDATESAQVADHDRTEDGKWWYRTLTQKSAGPFSTAQMRLWQQSLRERRVFGRWRLLSVLLHSVP